MYRVVRVLSAESSPVARIEAVDAEGHELRLEIPTTALADVATNHVLVLQWSAGAVPDTVLAPSAAEPQASLETTGSVDEQFMDLMAHAGRSTQTPEVTNPATPPAGARKPERGIEDEFNRLLGTAQRNGQRDGR